NLDAKLRIHMRAELKKLQKDIGVTVMYVTHDQVEAMTMADRICVMNQGRLQQFESPAKTYSKPANTFVADFMGSPPMNFIDCSYVEREEALFIDSGVFSLKLSNELGMLVKETAHSTELILGVRPKGMTVSYRKDDRLESFRARVFLVEPLGDESILDLKADSHVFKSVVPSDMKVELGSEVFVSLVESQIHLFDRKTGVAIT
ncbi:MAG: ABC transporter ATP-binding protein, partial [Candidatus Bathyarchaeia archaeon]